MADAALQPQAGTHTVGVRPHLDRGFRSPYRDHLPRFARRWAAVRVQPLCRRRCQRCKNDDLPAVPAALCRAADRSRVRVRERLSRHGECRGHGNLHSLDARPNCGRVVGLLQFSRRPAVERGSGVRHHLPAASGIDPAGRQLRRVCDGLRAADRRDHLEPRNLVSGSPGIELAYTDRLDHRRRHRPRALPRQDGTSGVDWGQATNVGKALLFSPLVGFVASALLLLAMKALIRQPELYRSPETDKPPAWWIRGLLIFTCTGVSFAHGSNDGQKGVGLIMLILIGTVPTAYALNRVSAESQIGQFSASSATASKIVEEKAAGYNILGNPRPAVMEYVAQHKINEGTYPSLAVLIKDIDNQVKQYGSLAKIPAEAVGNTRNDMYLVDEAIRNLMKDKDNELTKEEVGTLNAYKQSLDASTKFIPTWVKVAVAIALGLGTMIGWKRIVITVGEKIGKTHLTYGQGAAAELVAVGTIAAADMYGLPVSTTHVLSSGVAGTMAANGSGLQLSTIRNIALAWVLTLPMAMMLSAGLYILFLNLF